MPFFGLIVTSFVKSRADADADATFNFKPASGFSAFFKSSTINLMNKNNIRKCKVFR